jgi:hypothetical protein
LKSSTFTNTKLIHGEQAYGRAVSSPYFCDSIELPPLLIDDAVTKAATENTAGDQFEEDWYEVQSMQKTTQMQYPNQV